MRDWCDDVWQVDPRDIAASSAALAVPLAFRAKPATTASQPGSAL